MRAWEAGRHLYEPRASTGLLMGQPRAEDTRWRGGRLGSET